MHQSQRNGRLNYLDSFVNIFWPLIVPYILWIGRTLIIRTRRDHNVKFTVQSWRFCSSRTRNQASSCFSRLLLQAYPTLALLSCNMFDFYLDSCLLIFGRASNLSFRYPLDRRWSDGRSHSWRGVASTGCCPWWALDCSPLLHEQEVQGISACRWLLLWHWLPEHSLTLSTCHLT